MNAQARKPDTRAADVVSVADAADRVAQLDWPRIGRALDECGYALTPPLLSAHECSSLQTLFHEQDLFRSVVDMRRVRFGSGVYKYFDTPLPAPVAALRQAFYPHLAQTANDWARKLRFETRYPDSLEAFLQHCHQQGQTRPTPLIFRYETGDYNALHQDIYGEVGFPFQVLIVLSRREQDYTGGEFMLVTQRPRAQSIGEVITPDQGQALIFPNRHRPVEGKRGHYRVTIRHGVSALCGGTRYALGIIFHDAE